MANLELLTGSTPAWLVATRLSARRTGKNSWGHGSCSELTFTHLQFKLLAIDHCLPCANGLLPLGHRLLSLRHQLGYPPKILIDHCRQLLLEQNRQTPTHGHPG